MQRNPGVTGSPGTSAACSSAAAPVVKPLPSVVRVVVAEEVRLPCEASGLPRPSITWQKEGLSVPAGESPRRVPGDRGSGTVCTWLPPSCPVGLSTPAGRSQKALALLTSCPPVSVHHPGSKIYLSPQWLSWGVGEPGLSVRLPCSLCSPLTL